MSDLQIPILSLQNISLEDFTALAGKLYPNTAPSFSIGDVVLLSSSLLKTKPPALIIGIEPRDGGWFYHTVSARSYDGIMQREIRKESEIEAR